MGLELKKSRQICLHFLDIEFVPYSIFDDLSSPAWYGTFLDENSARFGMYGNFSRYSFEGCHVRSSACPYPSYFRRRVDCDKDNLRFSDTFRDLGGKKEVWLTSWNRDFFSMLEALTFAFRGRRASG